MGWAAGSPVTLANGEPSAAPPLPSGPVRRNTGAERQEEPACRLPGIDSSATVSRGNSSWWPAPGKSLQCKGTHAGNRVDVPTC
eukprot:2316145-Alexandrium_andersonii.AAC.1